MPSQFTFRQAEYNIKLGEERSPFASILTRRRSGVNGIVYKTMLTNDVWDYLANAPPNSAVTHFAVKMSKSERKDLGVAERTFLESLKKNDVYHEHLAMCYACFEYTDDLWFVMDLAEGNMEEFMLRHEYGRSPSLKLFDFEWLLRQMCGLAGALDSIHRPGASDVVDWQHCDVIGWHHDIKPENILWFGKGNNIDFRIADWGTAEIQQRHPVESGKYIYDKPLGSKCIGWPAYLPREALLGVETTCPPDVWSLGCVFVEVLIWFDRGYEALHDNGSDGILGFRHRRREKTKELREELKTKITNNQAAKNDDFNVFYGRDGHLLELVEETIASLGEETNGDTPRLVNNQANQAGLTQYGNSLARIG